MDVKLVIYSVNKCSSTMPVSVSSPLSVVFSSWTKSEIFDSFFDAKPFLSFSDFLPPSSQFRHKFGVDVENVEPSDFNL